MTSIPSHRLAIALLIASSFSALAETPKLPKDAQRLLDELAQYEATQFLDFHNDNIKRKKRLVQQLISIDSQITDPGLRWMNKLIKIQIAKLNREIKGIPQTHTKSIVQFNQPYHYQHPSEEYAHERGEITFFKNHTVKVQHSDNGSVVFSAEWTWKRTGNTLTIKADAYHGPITILPKNANSINIHWHGAINKTITATIKK